MSIPLLNLAYVGNTAQWALMLKSGKARFEACGPYQRRTARTRMTILTQSGAMDVSVPVHTGHGLTNRDVRVNYDTPWTRQQLYALRTAYNSSAYFEFYEDDYANILSKKHEFLWDLNLDMLDLTARLAGISLEWDETTTFGPAEEGYDDYRIAIEPKFANVVNDRCAPVSYTQVFATPYVDAPFVPWLSMLDLLFNEGPECRNVLRAMAL